MELNVLLQIAGLIISPASCIIAVRVSVAVLKARFDTLIATVMSIEKDHKAEAAKNQIQSEEIVRLKERVTVLEREVREAKERLHKKRKKW